MFSRPILVFILAQATTTLSFNTPFTLKTQVLSTPFVTQSRLVSQPRFSTAVPATDADTPVAEGVSSEGENNIAAVEEVATETEEVAVAGPEEPAVVDADEGKKLFVGNLPIEFTQDTIVELFESYGPVSEITVPVDRFTGAIRGFAFITLSDEESAARAIEEMNQKDIQGRLITVTQQRKPNEDKPKRQVGVQTTKLYVGNLPFEVDQEEITEYFSQFGNVVDCFIPIDRNYNRPRGFAFVNIAKDAADAAIEGTNGVEFRGRALQVNVSLPRGEAPPNRRTKTKTKLYIGNLSYDTDEETLRSLFQDYGEILDIYIPTDRETGRMRGFAFVTMEPEAATRAADETDGFELYGRILRVNEAQPKGGDRGGRPRRNEEDYDGANSWGEEQGTDSWSD